VIIRDGDWTLFSSDIKRGKTVWVRTEPDGSHTYRTDYDVTRTIETNREQRNISGNSWSGDYHMIASVPLNVFHDQLAEASRQGDEKFISKWLNDSNNRAWRTKDGNV
jgi:hypothetical protein